MSSSNEASSSHGALLSDSLRQLEIQQAAAATATASHSSDDLHEIHLTPKLPRTPHSRDDYGFRKSGISSPQSSADPNNPSRVPYEVGHDPNGLGWPGEPVDRH